MSLTLLFILVFIFGTVIGSFLNVVIWRLPRDQKLSGRSHCPNCKHKLSGFDLVPVFSFLLSNGRCRYCHKKISVRYPLLEIITGTLFVLAAGLVIPLSGVITLIDVVTLLEYCFVCSILLVVFVIDFEHYLILDKIIYPSIVIYLCFNFLISTALSLNSLFDYWPFLLNSLFGAVAGFVPFYLLSKLSKGRWMGMGDAKLGLFLGVVFGFPQIWVCYFISFLLGTAVALPLLITGQKQLSSKIPFGTFLAVSAIITMCFGLTLTSWYFGLIGLT